MAFTATAALRSSRHSDCLGIKSRAKKLRALGGSKPRVPHSTSHLVQPEFAVHRFELRRFDQLAVRDAHRMQRPLKLLHPESQKAVQFGKFGKEIVVLPDV